MKNLLKFILGLALVALVAIQFVRPQRNNGGYATLGEFEGETKPSVRVAAILKENCYDCHSAQTQYPWYAQIAPVSIWLQEHIDHGKSHFNAADWGTYSPNEKDQILKALAEKVEAGEMPLKSYTWLHGALPEEDRELVLQWAGIARLQHKKALQVSDSQYFQN